MAISRETTATLEVYQGLLLKWQEKINLISPSTVETAWSRHFEDSLQLLPLLPDDVKTIYDLGSGAGFPGMVLAICRPDLAVSLIESDSKKCAFLQTVSRETGARVTIVNKRIEEAAHGLPAPDLITARALSSLEDLLDYCHPWLKTAENLKVIFPKGEQFSTELARARSVGWAFDLTVVPSKTDPNAAILCLSNIKKTTL